MARWSGAECLAGQLPGPRLSSEPPDALPVLPCVIRFPGGKTTSRAGVLIAHATNLVDASGRSALSETMVCRVQPAVVDVAPQLEIGEVGRSAGGPVAAVVDCTQLGRRRAARTQAVAIAQVERLPQLPGHRPGAVPDVEDLTPVVHQHWCDGGVIGEAAGG